MNEWTGKTCIRFKRRTNEKDYVVFALRRLEAVSVICYEIILSNHELVCLNEKKMVGEIRELSYPSTLAFFFWC